MTAQILVFPCREDSPLEPPNTAELAGHRGPENFPALIGSFLVRSTYQRLDASASGAIDSTISAGLILTLLDECTNYAAFVMPPLDGWREKYKMGNGF